MITSQEAFRLILSTTRDFGSELISLQDAVGRMLAEDIQADRPFPPFDRICMDGMAIQHPNTDVTGQIFRIKSVQGAGSPPETLDNPGEAIEVMTGAMMPLGTTTVIRYEDLEEVEEGKFKVIKDPGDRANIHFTGQDLGENNVLIEKGALIRAAEVAICATVGKSEVRVKKQPKVAIVSSGDELIEIDHKPEPYQIRRSNAYMLRAQLERFNLNATLFHLQDDPSHIRESLERVLDSYDVILMSGGVSKGKFDYIPDVLNELGVKKLFHRVSQRPGKPFWFGQNERTQVFAFPGNPVSTLVGSLKYFKPWLNQCLGYEEQPRWVTLTKDFTFKPDLTYFAQIKTESRENGLFGEIIKGNGSGDMVSLAGVQGFVELPRGRDLFKKGETFPFIPM